MMSSRHNSKDNWSNNKVGVGREGRRISLSEASNKFWTLFVTWAFVFKQSEDVGTSRVGNSAYKMSRLASNKQTVPCTVSRTADLPEHWVFRLFIPNKFYNFVIVEQNAGNTQVHKKSMLNTTPISDFCWHLCPKTTAWPCLIPVAFLLLLLLLQHFNQESSQTKLLSSIPDMKVSSTCNFVKREKTTGNKSQRERSRNAHYRCQRVIWQTWFMGLGPFVSLSLLPRPWPP